MGTVPFGVGRRRGEGQREGKKDLTKEVTLQLSLESWVGVCKAGKQGQFFLGVESSSREIRLEIWTRSGL